MKAKKKVKSVKLNEKGEKVKHSDAKFGVDDILLKVDKLVSELQYDLAYKFCVRAVELEPQNELALCAFAEVLLELGQISNAKDNFTKAIKSSPAGGYTKYLHMGQLCQGHESLSMYEKGLQLMFKLKREPNASTDEPEVSDRDISEVYCAMGELYLTDLCDEDDAQVQCESFLNKSIQSDSTNSNALQTMASFLLSCNKKEEAIEYLKKSLEFWLPSIQSLVSDSETAEGGSEVSLECDLNFEKRKTCARLLLETEMFVEADSVLDILVAELDSDPEVWYLSGLRHFLQGSSQFEQAQAYFDQSLDLAGDEPEHKEICKHIKSLLKEMSEDSDIKMDTEAV